MPLRPLLSNPLAMLPLALSSAALAVVVGHVMLYGLEPQRDEGTAAHAFQLLILAEPPIVAMFLWKWLARAPRSAFTVLAVQLVALGIALAPVRYCNL